MSTSPKGYVGNVRSDMDIAYPEPLSHLHRHSVLAEYPKSFYNPKKNTKSRRALRYRTQPVTFDEIKEVDEETMAADQNEQARSMTTSFTSSKLELELYKLKKSFDDMKIQVIPDNGIISDAVTSDNPNSGAKTGDQTRWQGYTREGSI